MAAKNSVKTYYEGAYYHIYNRGVEKRLIFLDKQDYNVFLHYLREYLMPKDEKGLYERLSNPNISYKERDKILKLLRLNNFADEITFMSYCLMPNHFHFLVKQRSENSIDRFMNSFCVRYVKYFNTKYKRVGPLFQGVYKAIAVEKEEYLLYLTGYVHRNPVASEDSIKHLPLQAYISQPSSYPEYLGKRQTEWLHTEEILSFFSKKNLTLSYQNFVEQEEIRLPTEDLFLDL